MKLWSDSFVDGGDIPDELAFGVIDPVSHVRLSGNKNPHLAWSDLPKETQSLVLICHDPDVPSRGDDVNQEGRSVPKGLPRVDFFHWILVDIPVVKKEIGQGEFSDGVTARGKPGPQVNSQALSGLRHGINDYTGWFSSDPNMSGKYFGYDGPCPPWNDELVHRYVFTLYALDIPKVPVEGEFTGQQVRDAIEGRILAQASLTGCYSLNPALLK